MIVSAFGVEFPDRSSHFSSGGPMARVPWPHLPVRGSRTGHPTMALLDLLGRRWTLRVVWELRSGPLTFRALGEACSDISPAVLNERLGELRRARLVELAPASGYRLTDRGGELLHLLLPVVDWAARWARGLSRQAPSENEPAGTERRSARVAAAARSPAATPSGRNPRAEATRPRPSRQRRRPGGSRASRPGRRAH